MEHPMFGWPFTADVPRMSESKRTACVRNTIVLLALFFSLLLSGAHISLKWLTTAAILAGTLSYPARHHDGVRDDHV